MYIKKKKEGIMMVVQVEVDRSLARRLVVPGHLVLAWCISQYCLKRAWRSVERDNASALLLVAIYI
jgi:hypothetical protein